MKPLTGFLTRLARDTRGNALAVMTAAIFPLLGMIGGGFDLSRMYIVKTRLQHACDAGALAGRRVMGGGVWAQNGGRPEQTANEFFDSNMANNAYGATNVDVTFTESAGRVTGDASANVPMTLMKVFGYDEMPMSVSCDAEMRLPNTDVMFVLDVTGSMNDTLSGDTQNKITGLRVAVRCFYEILARLNSEAVCDGGDPSGGTGEDTQIRFGFVPYSTNVNVGRLLETDWIADDWTYQSRARTTVWGRPTGDFTDGTKGGWGSWSTTTTTANNENACISTANEGVYPSARNTNYGLGKNESDGGLASGGEFEADQQWRDTERDYLDYRSSDKRCRYRTRTRNYNRTFEFDVVSAGTSGAVEFSAWRYRPVEFDVSGLKSGTSWNASITLPVGNNYADATVNWDGCIEERQTVRASSYLPIPADAFDLDIDREPDSNASRWGPALQAVSYVRRENYRNDSSYDRGQITTFTNFSRGGYACPGPARNLQEWPDPTLFDDYVDTLQPTSNTYHDIGLIWGARLLSPTGIFADRNATTPEGGEIERHLIFMTDGEACTSISNYQAYGIGWFDRRQTSDSSAPTDGCLTNGTLTQQVNARTAAVCEAVKNRNITLWVVWFGTTQTTIENQLRACATPDRFFSARNSLQLQQTFRSIANQISQLRLTS